MKTVLRVIGGKNDGREIAIKSPKFVIGRGDKAHLKPSSDLVSRNHCAISVRDGKVIVEDLKSRNGTYINGIKLAGPHKAKSGDSLRVGRLQLEIVIDHAAAGSKHAPVKGIAEAAARTASSQSPKKKQSIGDSVSDWLSDDDDDEPTVNTQRILTSAETVQLSTGDTDAFNATVPNEPDKGDVDATITDATIELPTDEKKKERFGKLPPRAVEEHQSSTTAADDVLKNFFNRR